MSDSSYHAMYQGGDIAGVSGDNSFEHCISSGTLPFYVSTNWSFKERTLYALQEISQLKQLPISDDVRKDFQIYFDPWNVKPSIHMNLSPALKSVNLLKMMNAWPHIASYLKDNHNFYNELEKIVLEKPPNSKEKQLLLPNLGFFNRCYNTLTQSVSGLSLVLSAARSGI